MKKNVYHQKQFQRLNVIREVAQAVFIAIGSVPALILEVFFRKNFGERYFTLLYSIIIFLVMFGLSINYMGNSDYREYYEPLAIQRFNVVWLLCSLIFMFVSILRRIEIHRSLHTIDFNKFSKYDGDTQAFVTKIANAILPKLGIEPTLQKIRLVIEPAIGILVGIVFVISYIGMTTGLIIIICSIIHLGREYARFAQARNLLLDSIDETICNEDLFDIFVEDGDITSDRGLRWFGPKPKDRSLREKVHTQLLNTEEETMVE